MNYDKRTAPGYPERVIKALPRAAARMMAEMVLTGDWKFTFQKPDKHHIAAWKAALHGKTISTHPELVWLVRSMHYHWRFLQRTRDA